MFCMKLTKIGWFEVIATSSRVGDLWAPWWRIAAIGRAGAVKVVACCRQSEKRFSDPLAAELEAFQDARGYVARNYRAVR